MVQVVLAVVVGLKLVSMVLPGGLEHYNLQVTVVQGQRPRVHIIAVAVAVALGRLEERVALVTERVMPDRRGLLLIALVEVLS